MFPTTRLSRHLSVALFAATTFLAPGRAAAQTPPPGAEASLGAASFVVLVQGVRVGTMTATVTRAGTDWVIGSTGRLTPPFDLSINKFEVRYASDWQPQQLAVDAVLRGQALTLATSFGLTTATSDVVQGMQRGSNTQQVSPRTVVLPSNFFGAFEALALRAASLTPGTRVPIFIAPEPETSLVVNRVGTHQIAIGGATVDVREVAMSVTAPGGLVPLEIWVDAHNRLVRLVLPAASLVVVRDDVAGVMAREVHIRNPGDAEVFIPANGFTIGATVTRPAAAAGARPGVVVLVGGPGHVDRDDTVFGIPIMGQLAGSIAAAGYAVVRYDNRGSGRSGGRVESAGLSEYVEDLLAVVSWTRNRKDLDPDRIAVAGYAEGAAIAMTAAAREKKIRAIALVNAPGRSGREVSLEQQARLLEQLNLAPADRDAKIALQMRIMDAAVTRKGIDDLPPDLRAQASAPWFRSWLQFDPAAVMPKIEQPVLVLHGALDAEMPPSYADTLDTLARARKKAPDALTRKTVVPGVNHLLVPSKTGAMDEYPVLEARAVSPEVGRAIAEWLAQALPAK